MVLNHAALVNVCHLLLITHSAGIGLVVFSCCRHRRVHFSLHISWINISSPQAFVPRILGMYFIAALALIFYVSKVPERYFPGETAFWLPLFFRATHSVLSMQFEVINIIIQISSCCRSTELPGLQSPGVAPAAGADVLLVAPVIRLHHGIQTQPALPRHPPTRLGRCSATPRLCCKLHFTLKLYNIWLPVVFQAVTI